ncbi:MAG: alpha/beta fold hydrolase, partial [Myxococcota bacterium]
DEGGVFQNKRTLDAHTFDYDNASFEEVLVDAGDGVELYAWHITREPAAKTVLYFGGQGFHLVLAREFVTDMLADVPVNLFLVDYRGYGRSSGEPTVAGLKQDALAIYDLLTTERGVPPADLVVHGHSMGSFMASYVAAERPVAGLVLESPVTEVEGWTKALVPGLLRVFLKFDIQPELAAESNTQRVGTITAPTLMMVGSEDPITPQALAEELHAASAAGDKRLVVIEGGNHNDLPSFDVFVDAYASYVTGL